MFHRYIKQKHISDLQDLIGQTIVDVEQVGVEYFFIHRANDVIMMKNDNLNNSYKSNTQLYIDNIDPKDLEEMVKREGDVYIDCIKRIGDISKGPITMVNEMHDEYSSLFSLYINKKNYLEIRWIGKNPNNIKNFRSHVFMNTIEKFTAEYLKRTYLEKK